MQIAERNVRNTYTEKKGRKGNQERERKKERKKEKQNGK
jgi:hypothetical protein